MRKILLLITLIVLTAFVGGCSGRTSDFGYIDMQKVLSESTKVKTYQEQLDKKMTELEELDKKEKGAIPDADYEQNKKMRQAELMTMGKELEAEFKESMNKAMTDTMNEKKLGAILVKGSVLQGGVDVTDDIIKHINK